MKEYDLTSQTAICGDVISNLAMIAQELNPDEEAKVLISEEYEGEVDVYKDMLKMLNTEVIEVSKENDKICLILRKLER